MLEGINMYGMRRSSFRRKHNCAVLLHNLQEEAPDDLEMGDVKCSIDQVVQAPGRDLDWHKQGSVFSKVPTSLKRGNPQPFEPLLFFFGPYQYAALASDSARAAASVDGKHLKQKVAKAVLKEGQLEKLALKIERHYPEIKDIYFQVTSEEWNAITMVLAKSMALDAVVVVAALEIYLVWKKTPALFGHVQQCPYPDLAAFFSVPILEMLMKDAALLVENQVPLNVLRYAFESLKPSSYASFDIMVTTSVCAVSERYFPNHKPRWPNGRKCSDCLLGAIYDSLTPCQDYEDPQKQLDQFNKIYDNGSPLLTASHLLLCGIRFRVLNQVPRRHGDGRSSRARCINFTKKAKEPEVPNVDGGAAFMSSIRFNEKRKVIELPRINVGEGTVRFLHNLLAYEVSCRFPKERCVVSYVDFMDHLIDTEEDVKILEKAGVIRNNLGSYAELATNWNKLCKSVPLCSTRKDYEIIEQVHAIANSRWGRWKAGFREKYWEKKPWLLVSLVVAFVLLVSTVLQTIFTIKSAM